MKRIGFNSRFNDIHAWMFLGVVFYLAYSLISWDIRFSHWHWSLRAIYVIGGIISFFKAL